jgi:hypothetical protein
MFRTVPVFGADQRVVAEVLRGAMNGKTNNHGTITLATGNATTTTLYDERISPDSKIILIPFSDAAEADSAPYGQFTNNNDQVAPSVGTSAVVEFDTTEFSHGIYLSNTTRINVRNAGLYNAQFSMQLVNYANSIEHADVWFRVNGTDVPRSASRFDHVIGTVNTFLDLNADDYIELAGYVSDTNVTLEHYPADAGIPRPSIPSVIFTVNYVAPMAYSNVYVSAQAKGSATISHYANSTADKTYAYVIVG